MRSLSLAMVVWLVVAHAAAQPWTDETGAPPSEVPEETDADATDSPADETVSADEAAEAAEDAPGDAPAADPAPATPAAPDRVVVLSVGGDATADEAREAREAVAAVLRAEGLSILPDADVTLSISPRRLAACQRARCAFEIGRSLGVAMVAAVARWADDDGGSLTVSLITGARRSHSATEPITEGDVAAAARAAVAQTLAARRRAFLVEGSGTSLQDDEPDPDDDTPRVAGAEIVPAEQVNALNRERSLEEWVLPSLLAVVGLGLVGVAVYALLDEMCTREGASGTCLAGSRPNVGLGIASAITGALAIAGGIVWLVVGGQPNANMNQIDVVLGPEGGGVTVRGRF